MRGPAEKCIGDWDRVRGKDYYRRVESSGGGGGGFLWGGGDGARESFKIEHKIDASSGSGSPWS